MNWSRVCSDRHYCVKFTHSFKTNIFQKIIRLRKRDFKSAYKRHHLRAKTAVKSAVRVKLDGRYYILVSLRLPFGGSPCPSYFYLVSDIYDFRLEVHLAYQGFCLVSDIITDTTNDFIGCESWDTDKIFSNYVTKIPPP